MKYNAITKDFTIDKNVLEFVALSIPYAIKNIRLASSLPLDKYKNDDSLDHADYAMRALIEIAEKIGIDYGVRWGNELDVRDAG